MRIAQATAAAMIASCVGFAVRPCLPHAYDFEIRAEGTPAPAVETMRILENHIDSWFCLQRIVN